MREVFTNGSLKQVGWRSGGARRRPARQPQAPVPGHDCAVRNEDPRDGGPVAGMLAVSAEWPTVEENTQYRPPPDRRVHGRPNPTLPGLTVPGSGRRPISALKSARTQV